jgi:predicted ArsR family transcriptional regulator
MESEPKGGVDRRGFLVRSVPACAVTCLALGGVSPAAAAQASPPQAGAPRHPFDEEVPMPRKPTFREEMQRALVGSRHVALMQFLTRTLGREKGLQLLESFATEDGTANGQAAAKRMGGNSFASLAQMFSPARYKGLCVMTVKQSSDVVHEIEVTECLWATVCRGASAAEEGHAAICHGDFAFSRAFNPQVTMTRDKTLMQGHACCNHRWTLKA